MSAISLTGTTTYTQNFDSLANSGANSSLMPPGWEFLESGNNNANTTYRIGDGSTNTGDTYSYGTASDSERALGGLQSNAVIPTLGVSFTNNTGSTITSLTINYRGEQWRLGPISQTQSDRLDFQYSLNATSLSTGTWTDFDALDFSSLVTSGTSGPLDGNASENNINISNTISGLNIGDGQTFYLRWEDFNVTGADDGLAIDDFSLTPTLNAAPTAISLSNSTISLQENTDTTSAIKVADITVTDDGVGTNNLSVTGTDASFFEIIGQALYLKAGTVLDYETKTGYNVSVEVDDSTVGSTPDVTIPYTLAVTDVNEGTSGSDLLRGSAIGDLIQGLAGSDRLYGNAGNDTLDGDDGNDLLYGGKNNDLLSGGNGSDRLYGDSGNDTLQGDAGNDILYGGVGDDLLDGGGGSDRLYGNAGIDTFILEAGMGKDIIYGFENGSDIIQLEGGLSFGVLEIVKSGSSTLIKIQDTQETLATLSGINIGLVDATDFAVGN